MILYFDSYITDIPFKKSYVSPNETVRAGCKNYAMPKKIDIAKYTLSSYAVYPWSDVLIKYKLDDLENYELFDEFIKKLFPEAVIIRHRSDNQQKLKESMSLLENFNSDWIFYSANNDHPLIAPDISMLDQALKKAKELKLRHQLVSIIYSHFSEFINLPYPGNPYNTTFGKKDTRIIEEDENTVSVIRKEGDYSGIQIVNKKLFRHWFCSKNLGDERIIRPESVWEKVETLNQVVIMPKREICAHFDGYSHTMGSSHEIRPEQIPPLFIPLGFFEKEIRIAYGYNKYRPDWTNINPAAKKFSFEDNKEGADLKIGLENLPLFWKSRIKKMDTNQNADLEKIEKGKQKYFKVLCNPYKLSNKPLDLHTLKFYLIWLPMWSLKDFTRAGLLLIGGRKLLNVTKQVWFSIKSIFLQKNQAKKKH